MAHRREHPCLSAVTGVNSLAGRGPRHIEPQARIGGAFGKRTRASELQIPKLIPEAELDEIIATARIRGPSRARVAARTNGLIGQLARMMREKRSDPGVQNDRSGLEKALDQIRGARAALHRQGKSGKSALGTAVALVGATSLREGHHEAGPAATLMRAVIHYPALPARQFGNAQSAATLDDILRQTERCVGIALTLLKKGGRKGGPTPLVERHLLIMALAEIWAEANLKLSSGAKSKFTGFAHNILEAIG